MEAILAAWRRARPDLSLQGMGVYLRLHRVHYGFHRAVAVLTRGTVVKAGEMFVLMALRRSAPSFTLRPTDLFRTLLVTSAAMTKRIDRLEKLGFVERIPDARDRRCSLVRLTKQGRIFADRAISNVASVVEQVVPRQVASQTERVLKRMDTALEGLTDLDSIRSSADVVRGQRTSAQKRSNREEKA